MCFVFGLKLENRLMNELLSNHGVYDEMNL